jgi:type I restriction enzyme M protein
LWCIVSLPGGVFSTAGAGVKTNLLFFTKGKKTERIWYYDLSQIKIGKKTPMTLAYFGFDKHGTLLDDADLPVTLTGDWREQDGNQGKPFPTLARLLAMHGTPDADSDFSWTIDFIARRAKAREDMASFLDEVKKLTEELIPLKEELKTFNKGKVEKDVIAALEEGIKTKDKLIREAQARATDIDAAFYGLKAVNPNVKTQTDTRTAMEIIDNINRQGQIVATSMNNLRGLLAE